MTSHSAEIEMGERNHDPNYTVNSGGGYKNPAFKGDVVCIVISNIVTFSTGVIKIY